MSRLPIYDRLMHRYKTEGPKPLNMIAESTKINTIMRMRDPDLKPIKELIDAIILHHACLDNRDYESGRIPYHGRNLQKDVCPRYDLRQFPPVLLQILSIFMSEVTE